MHVGLATENAAQVHAVSVLSLPVLSRKLSTFVVSFPGPQQQAIHSLCLKFL